MRERRLPHVLVDHRPEPGTRTVNIDDRGGARATADHLTGLGHRRLGIVDGWDKRARTGPEAEAEAVYYVNKERMAGWRAGAEAAGIDWGSVQTASGPGFDRATGRVAALRMLDLPEPPTAIVTYSDRLARGVLDAAAERGVRVPAGAVGGRFRRCARGRPQPPAAHHGAPAAHGEGRERGPPAARR